MNYACTTNKKKKKKEFPRFDIPSSLERESSLRVCFKCRYIRLISSKGIGSHRVKFDKKKKE